MDDALDYVEKVMAGEAKIDPTRLQAARMILQLAGASFSPENQTITIEHTETPKPAHELPSDELAKIVGVSNGSIN